MVLLCQGMIQIERDVSPTTAMKMNVPSAKAEE
jgi:hypothetical protein